MAAWTTEELSLPAKWASFITALGPSAFLSATRYQIGDVQRQRAVSHQKNRSVAEPARSSCSGFSDKFPPHPSLGQKCQTISTGRGQLSFSARPVRKEAGRWRPKLVPSTVEDRCFGTDRLPLLTATSLDRVWFGTDSLPLLTSTS